MRWILIPAVFAMAAGSTQEPDIQIIMQRKLDHAHAVLDALISEDFETLVDSARALNALSEEAGWFILQSPEYAQRSAGFRLAVAEIQTSAENRSLEGAALGYVDMTLKCVRCHQLLRGTQTAGGFAPTLGQSTQFPPRSR